MVYARVKLIKSVTYFIGIVQTNFCGRDVIFAYTYAEYMDKDTHVVNAVKVDCMLG